MFARVSKQCMMPLVTRLPVTPHFSQTILVSTTATSVFCNTKQ